MVVSQMEHVNGASEPKEAYFLSFKTVLRNTVLMCIGKGSRGPHLEKSGDGGEGLELNPGYRPGLNLPTSQRRPGATLDKPSRGEGESSSTASSPLTEAGPLVATKTVLLVKGKEGNTLHKRRHLRLVGFTATAAAVVVPPQSISSRL